MYFNARTCQLPDTPLNQMKYSEIKMDIFNKMRDSNMLNTFLQKCKNTPLGHIYFNTDTEKRLNKLTHSVIA